MKIADLQTIIAALGGLAGLGTLIATFINRRKIRAEAADVITDTAITLVEPLRKRVEEVTKEASEARDETRKAREEARRASEETAELRISVTEILGTLRRWRAAVLSPHISRDELRQMVRADSTTGVSDTPHP